MSKHDAIKVGIEVVGQGSSPYWAGLELAATATDEDTQSALGLAADMLIEWRRKRTREGSTAGGTAPPALEIDP